MGINVVMAIVGRGGAKPQRAVRTRGGDDQEVFSLGDDAAMRTSKKVSLLALTFVGSWSKTELIK